MTQTAPSRRGAGGTPGGVGQFLFGLLLASIGGYLLTNTVRVSTGFWSLRWTLFGGFSVTAFGLTLILFLLGVGMLFFNGRSIPGWLLTVASLVWIVVGVLANLEFYFGPTSLFVTLGMLALLGAGLGLMVRALRSVELPPEPR